MSRKLIESWARMYELKAKNNTAALERAIDDHAKMIVQERVEDYKVERQKQVFEKYVEQKRDRCREVLATVHIQRKAHDNFKRCLDYLSA